MKLVSAALVAAGLSIGLAGFAQAAQAAPAANGSDLVVKASKTTVGTQGLRRTPRM